jgi:hypothetical protein
MDRAVGGMPFASSDDVIVTSNVSMDQWQVFIKESEEYSCAIERYSTNAKYIHRDLTGSNDLLFIFSYWSLWRVTQLYRVRKIQRDLNIFSCCKAIIDRNNPIWSKIWHTLHTGAVGKYQKFCSRIESYG